MVYTNKIYKEQIKMSDIFENIILCKECGKRMHEAIVLKNGFKLRALQCPECKKKIYHPADIEEYRKFESLKNKFFKVKLRIVGNSYTVSIPREIIDFFDSEGIMKEMREMEEMVTLALEKAGKLSLIFGEE